MAFVKCPECVREYWIVDPVKQRVTVYFFEKETVEEYSYGTDIPVGMVV